MNIPDLNNLLNVYYPINRGLGMSLVMVNGFTAVILYFSLRSPSPRNVVKLCNNFISILLIDNVINRGTFIAVCNNVGDAAFLGPNQNFKNLLPQASYIGQFWL
jgi:hypothetical protein